MHKMVGNDELANPKCAKKFLMIKTKLMQWLNWSKFIKLEIYPKSRHVHEQSAW